MAQKKSNDPTQSLWISKKYESEFKKHMQQFCDQSIAITKQYWPDIGKIKEETDKLKAEMLETNLRPMVEKYIGMSVQQGSKFGKLRKKGV